MGRPTGSVNLQTHYYHIALHILCRKYKQIIAQNKDNKNKTNDLPLQELIDNIGHEFRLQ